MSEGWICPKCGKEMREEPTSCPDNKPGCCVYHFRYYCPDCDGTSAVAYSTMGWKCPECGKVYAPWVSECTQCGKEGWVSHPCDTTSDIPYETTTTSIDDNKYKYVVMQ